MGRKPKAVNGCQADSVMFGGVEYQCILGGGHDGPICRAEVQSQEGIRGSLTWPTQVTPVNLDRCRASIFVDEPRNRAVYNTHVVHCDGYLNHCGQHVATMTDGTHYQW